MHDTNVATTAAKLRAAYSHLTIAKEILNESEMMNYKIDCDFDSIFMHLQNHYPEPCQEIAYE